MPHFRRCRPQSGTAADFLGGEAGSGQACTSVLRLEKTNHCAGAPAAAEQPSMVVLVAEEVGDNDRPHGRLLSLADMPSFYAATRKVKDYTGCTDEVHPN